MPNLNVTELANQGRDTQNNLLPAMQQPALAVQNLAIGGSSALSAAFQSQTGVIRVACDIACYYLISTGPTAATTTGVYLPGGSFEFVPVPQGQSMKIAVISA